MRSELQSSLPHCGSVLGVDVGYSPTRRSSAVCRLDWGEEVVSFRIDRFRAIEKERVETIRNVIGGKSLLAAAFDGPLRQGLDEIGRYRTAERLLTRRLQPWNGKPGQSSTPVGKRLNGAANLCASVVLAATPVAEARHRYRINDAAICEAFPTSFLGLLIAEPKALNAQRADRSDIFYAHLASSGGLTKLINHVLPKGQLVTSFEGVSNHDGCAAVVCALTALCVAAGDFTVVGDADGWIVLPPRSLIQPWAWSHLVANAARGELAWCEPGVARRWSPVLVKRLGATENAAPLSNPPRPAWSP